MWDSGVHWSELAANASIYEIITSKPDAGTARAIWIVWAACSGISTVFAGTVVTAVLASPKALSSAFNVYLAFLLSVEAYLGLSVLITCQLNIAHDGYVGWAMCSYQGWYLLFAAGSAFYLNLLIAIEVFRLLSATKRLDFYVPPTQRAAVVRCMSVLLSCALVSSMSMWRVLPHQSRLLRGLICLSSGSSTVGRLSPITLRVTLPLLILLPTSLCFALALVSWRRGLFDFSTFRTFTSGNSKDLHMQAVHRSRLQQSRMITMYFARIFIVLLLWYPALVVTFLPIRSPLAVAVILPCVFLQSAVSACMSLTKTDVREATIGLFGSRLFYMCTPPSQVACRGPRPGDGLP
jgi:hypothetical protein